MKKHSGVRTSIVAELKKQPLTVTQLMEKLTDISSLGTLSYHLKQLKKEKTIDSKKEKNARGQPTIYFLINDKRFNAQDPLKEIVRKMELQENEFKLKFLKYIENKSYVSDDELIGYLKKQKTSQYDTEMILQSALDCVGDELSTMHYKITPQGKKFLKENSK